MKNDENGNGNGNGNGNAEKTKDQLYKQRYTFAEHTILVNFFTQQPKAVIELLGKIV